MIQFLSSFYSACSNLAAGPRMNTSCTALDDTLCAPPLAGLFVHDVAAVGEERGTLEDVTEPFLIQQGFMVRTARGRMVTRTAYLHFGLKPPERVSPNLPLFEEPR